ncbi:MAG: hypothetical protein WDO14_05185 [Bacteroidota bacterium]
MIRRATVLLTLVLIASSTFAQTTTKTTRRPNIPGSILFDFGFNGVQGQPNLWKQRFIATRSINIYYQYPIRFGRSRFSFNPGLGFSLERFAWKTNIILENPREGTSTQVEKYEFGLARLAYPNPRKPTLVTNYFDIPLELRFDTKPEDISRSFNVAIGARGGWMFDSFMKVKYKEDGQTKKVKDKQDFGLTQLRYGVYTRIGVGAFNLFCFYNLTPLFKKDMGPSNDGSVNENGLISANSHGTTMNTLTIGVSLNGF